MVYRNTRGHIGKAGRSQGNTAVPRHIRRGVCQALTWNSVFVLLPQCIPAGHNGTAGLVGCSWHSSTWMHHRSAASFGADIPRTANCIQQSKITLPFPTCEQSYVTKGKVLEIWSLRVRSVARDLSGKAHMFTHQADKSCRAQCIVAYSIVSGIHSRSSGKLDAAKNRTRNT